MSLGFIPVIISIILCEFITQDMSIYIGAGAGLLFSIYSVRHRGTHVPQIILYCTTGMLLLLSVTTLFLVNYCPRFMLPFTLEISAIIPPFVIYLNRRKFLDYHMSQTQKCCKQLFAQGAEAAIVSSRVILIISLLHFLIIFLAVLVSYPLGDTTRHILFYVAPPLVFISGILFNQFGIFYFNIVMNHTVFVPIVNTKGDVMGKAIASEAINRKNDYINPVIRIAVASHGMLFLLPRPKCNVFEKDKIDLLLHGRNELVAQTNVECRILGTQRIESGSRIAQYIECQPERSYTVPGSRFGLEVISDITAKSQQLIILGTVHLVGI